MESLQRSLVLNLRRCERFARPLAFVLLLFFFSGALALVYQVVWSRMMTHVFGSTAVAVGTVLAAAGTSLPSPVSGRCHHRHRESSSPQDPRPRGAGQLARQTPHG